MSADIFGLVEDEAYGEAAGAGDDSGVTNAAYGSGLIGGILDAAIGPVMANVQKGWSSRAARKARQWAEYMASTQYQRTVKDLEAAGLNPILAVGRGPGAVPGGPVAQTPDIEEKGSISRGLASAQQARAMAFNAKILQENARKAKNEADASENATKMSYAQIGEILARQGLIDEQAKSTAMQTKGIEASAYESVARTAILNAQRPEAEALGEFYKSEGGKDVKQLMPLIQLLRAVLGK